MDYAIKLLAVVGGAAVGAVIVSLLVRLVSRWFGVSKSPRRALIVLRGLGAVVAGWVVWLLVFGVGGGGIGGSGGLGRGGGPSQEPGKGDQRPVESQLSLGAPTAEPSNYVAIAMLGGARVKGERFYLVVGEKAARTLDELKEFIRQQQATRLHGIEILIYEDSVAADHAAVTKLQDWARANDLAIKMSFSGAEAP